MGEEATTRPRGLPVPPLPAVQVSCFRAPLRETRDVPRPPPRASLMLAGCESVEATYSVRHAPLFASPPAPRRVAWGVTEGSHNAPRAGASCRLAGLSSPTSPIEATVNVPSEMTLTDVYVMPERSLCIASSSAVSSAAGRSSSRPLAMGTPLLIERP